MFREFIQQKGRTSKPVKWAVAVHGAQVTQAWGQVGGKMQETSRICEPVNVGKANEKSAEQTAIEYAERMILKKTREGFVPLGEEAEESAGSITDFGNLPQNLRFYKPQRNPTKYLQNIVDRGEAWAIRKRDGECMIAACDDNRNWRFYTANMIPWHKDEVEEIEWTARLEHIVQALNGCDIPPKTILLGELVADQGYDSFNQVSSIKKSLTERAMELQFGEGGKPLWYCIWDLAFLDGEDMVSKRPFRVRWDTISYFLRDYPEFLCQPEMSTADDVEELKRYAKKVGWEGYVLVAPEDPYEDKAYSFHGKAERPKSCAKLKIPIEADFIARFDPENGIGAYGKGKKSGGVGAAFLYLWDEEKKEEVYISKCGGGLTDEQVFSFADPSLYPMIWQVEFMNWTEKGSLRQPEFIRVRDDKSLEECGLDQRPQEE